MPRGVLPQPQPPRTRPQQTLPVFLERAWHSKSRPRMENGHQIRKSATLRISANPNCDKIKHPMLSLPKLQCKTWPTAQDHCKKGASIVPRGPHHISTSTSKIGFIFHDFANPVHGAVAAIGASDRQRQWRSCHAGHGAGLSIAWLSNPGSHHERTVATKHFGS